MFYEIESLSWPLYLSHQGLKGKDTMPSKQEDQAHTIFFDYVEAVNISMISAWCQKDITSLEKT